VTARVEEGGVVLGLAVQGDVTGVVDIVVLEVASGPGGWGIPLEGGRGGRDREGNRGHGDQGSERRHICGVVFGGSWWLVGWWLTECW